MASHRRTHWVITDERGPLVVLLHGFASEPGDIAPFAKSMGVGARFAFPEGPIDLAAQGRRGRAWWPSDGDGRQRAIVDAVPRDLSQYEPEGLDEARAGLGALLHDLMGETNVESLILGGFSQGAMLAFDLALRSVQPLTALVQLSGSRIASRLWNPRLQSRAGTRAFISHGKQDPDLSFTSANEFQAALGAAGWLVDFCPFDGGHEIPITVLRRLKRFLREVSADGHHLGPG
jgi:phospholipase/carboxylesterase